ncbi:MAG TPA: indole-3-glycerol phosphate synthase TrpC [Acidimicrobiales bacterium]|nr:indole-3-glycerol phosphate synthase TrpC [Acidimicrobiales bacterium]
MGTYLDPIVAAHRAAAAEDYRKLDKLVDMALDTPAPLPFAAALREGGGLAVIAEIKRRSPSRGNLAPPGLAAGKLAEAYADGGARAISVLTDEEYFGGSALDLVEARSAVGIPILRKDFTVSGSDVCDARLMGADAVLLIVSALAGGELEGFIQLAEELSLDALVEVHDETELERALGAGASLIGVNQRDLQTFEVDADRGLRLAMEIPAGLTRVAESGIKGPEQALRMFEGGYHAVLVGESVVTSEDPAAAVNAFVSACS